MIYALPAFDDHRLSVSLYCVKHCGKLNFAATMIGDIPAYVCREARCPFEIDVTEPLGAMASSGEQVCIRKLRDPAAPLM